MHERLYCIEYISSTLFHRYACGKKPHHKIGSWKKSGRHCGENAFMFACNQNVGGAAQQPNLRNLQKYNPPDADYNMLKLY